MTASLRSGDVSLPLASFSAECGRFCVCPTPHGLHVTIQRYDGPPHGMMLDREQALELLRLLQQEYAGQG